MQTTVTDGKPLTSIVPKDQPKLRTYRAIIKSLKDCGMSAEDIGKTLGRALAGADSKLSANQAALIGEAQGLLAFEGTHPNKSMGHNRDVVHGMMASQSMAEGKMQTGELRQLPSAGMHSGKAAAANDEPARQTWFFDPGRRAERDQAGTGWWLREGAMATDRADRATAETRAPRLRETNEGNGRFRESRTWQVRRGEPRATNQTAPRQVLAQLP